MQKAGVLVGLSYDGQWGRLRNLPFLAGTAAGFGASKEEALQMAAVHAKTVHGLETVSPEVVQKLKSIIREESSRAI